MESVEIIKGLALAFGPSGFEDEVVALGRDFAHKMLPKARIVEDATRNLYICLNGEYNCDLPTVLVDAHSDEVGLMVRYVKDNGTLAFTTLGGWIPHVLAAQRVVIRNVRGERVNGVLASKPPHFDRVQDGSLKMDDMVIDIGATSKAEAVEGFGMAVGCPIVPHADFIYNTEYDIIMSKAFDCRLGCASVIDVLRSVSELDLNINVVGAFSSQEEIGIRGARIVANKIKPDVAICFEGTPADDTFGTPEISQTALKKGPMLRHIDQGMITHPRFLRMVLDVAAKSGIAVQEAVRTGGSTNGSAYHLSNLGVPTVVIGHPVRYVHSPNSIAAMSDYKQGVSLAVEVLRTLNKEIIESF
jgi:putative aminopeptidase FrvX